MKPLNTRTPVNLLLLQSNAAEAQTMQRLLKNASFGAFAIRWVQEVEEAFSALDREKYHLILLDLALANEPGLETFARLHAEKPHVPIVVLTKLRDEEMAVEALQQGAQDYLIQEAMDAGLLARAIRYSIERHRALDALRDSQERYALAARATNDGLWDWNLRTGVIHYSARWCRMLGYTEEEIGNCPLEWFDRIHADDVDAVCRALQAHLDGEVDQFAHEYRMRHRNGHFLWMHAHGLALCKAGEAPHRIAGSQTDVTARKKTEQQLLHDALHDPLTGLSNRTLFQQRLKEALQRSQAEQESFALLLLDLDRFKTINDSLGHLIGDRLVAAIGKCLAGCVAPTDIVARLGGDEFAVLIRSARLPADGQHTAKRLLAAMETPFSIAGHQVYTTASIGIALGSPSYRSTEEVLRDADIALYRAKAAGTGQYRIFDQDMHRQAMALWQLETDLRRAMERSEFCIHYQPIVSLKTGQLAGVEALVRWQHPERGLLFPADFLAVADEAGLLGSIDRFMIQQGAAQLRQWHQEHPQDPALFLNLNLSGAILHQADLPQLIERVLRENKLPPNTLKLEITEGVVLRDVVRVTETLTALQRLNVQLCIDDFGTGYSSLSSLHYYPINTLKIDSSFVNNMNKDAGNTDIVRTIITLAHDLDLDVIAEGVETPGQLMQLQRLNCEFAQGSLFSHATEPSRTLAFMNREPHWFQEF